MDLDVDARLSLGVVAGAEKVLWKAFLIGVDFIQPEGEWIL